VLSPLRRTIAYVFRRPFTVMIPRETLELPDGYRGIHEINTDTCIGCGLCGKICPNKAIDYVFPEGKNPYDPKNFRLRRPAIDLGHCMFCALCEEVCPTNSIKLTKEFQLYGKKRIDLIRLPYELESRKEKRKEYSRDERAKMLISTELISRISPEVKQIEEKWRKVTISYYNGEISEEEYKSAIAKIESEYLEKLKEVGIL